MRVLTPAEIGDRPRTRLSRILSNARAYLGCTAASALVCGESLSQMGRGSVLPGAEHPRLNPSAAFTTISTNERGASYFRQGAVAMD